MSLYIAKADITIREVDTYGKSRTAPSSLIQKLGICIKSVYGYPKIGVKILTPKYG